MTVIIIGDPFKFYCWETPKWTVLDVGCQSLNNYRVFISPENILYIYIYIYICMGY